MTGNSSIRKSGVHSSLGHYKPSDNNKDSSTLQLSYYQDSQKSKLYHKHAGDTQGGKMGNLQRAVMDPIEQRIQEITETLSVLQNRQKKVTSPKNGDNNDLQMVNYHHTREQIEMPYQRLSEVGLDKA